LCVCDTDPEATGYVAALRKQGYTVVMVEQSALAERAHEAMPALILFDVDATGALDTIRALRALPDASRVEAVAIGAAGQTLANQAEAVALATSGQLLRPIDPHVLILTVETLIGAPPSLVAVAEGASAAAPLSILPASETDFEPAQAHLEISPELARLLHTAEERVADSIQKEPEVSFEHDPVDPNIIPPEALAALTRPLAGDAASSPGNIAKNMRLDPRSSRFPSAGSAPPSSQPSSVRSPTSNTSHDLAALDAPLSELPDELTRASGRPATEPPLHPEPEGHERTAAEPERPTVPPPRRQSDGDSSPPAQTRSPVSFGTQVSTNKPRLESHDQAPVLELPRRIDVAGAVSAAGHAVQARFSGALAFETEQGVRRALLKDGDFVIVVSGNDAESLVSYLASTGELEPEDAAQLAHRLPPFGRHTATALIARGKLKQEQLWPALRAHAQWLLGYALSEAHSMLHVEHQVPERLASEPTVFGGATGAEVLIEVVRRVISPAHASELLGGNSVVVDLNPDSALLNECALTSGEHEALHEALGLTLAEAARRSTLPDLATLLFALQSLGVLKVTRAQQSDSPRAALQMVPSPRVPSRLGSVGPQTQRAPTVEATASADVPAEKAQRARIAARKAVVDQGDYFAVLGVSPAATLHDIERAYQALKHEFEPSRVLTSQTVDLADDVASIVEVLDEAYAILQDTPRREAYRRAILTGP
jgi:DNA-binding NarL/FixJ family response regulator